jgi:phosphoglucosamine mutase
LKRLFGTDGIRSVAGAPPLDPETVRRFGAALADVLRAATDRPPRVVIGRDTRESGPWLRDAVVTGLNARGASAVDAGVLTTPGLAYATRTTQFDCGVMISASHNPFEDNGLKAFWRDGTKLPDLLETEIESRMLDAAGTSHPHHSPVFDEDPSLLRRYVEFLEGAVRPRGRFEGLRVALDCANGAACAIAPEVFRFHGASVHTLGDRPDGRNINAGCGSLHLESLSAAVREEGCAIGIAFDGDADRALAVDRKGRTVDGDHILYFSMRRLLREGALRGSSVVATVMTNLWLERRLADEGVRLLRAPVGDKYVLERMVAEDAVLGGEQSGHVILRHLSTTGDGILTGLVLLDSLLSEDRTLEAFLDEIVPYPQVLRNVKVREKPDLHGHPVIGPVVDEVERALDGTGRLLLRYSGTEPLARVMIEGTDLEAVKRHAERLALVIQSELGVV